MFAFHPAVSAWLSAALGAPTPVQAQGWPVLAGGRSALLIAPTGSGKTLAAFLVAIDALLQKPSATPGVRVLYVSPLKALVYDIERNLRAPLAGIGATAARMGLPIAAPRIGVRTGDTDARTRRQLRKHPPDILVTTPESLFLLLTSGARDALRSVVTVILDEVHVLAPTRRGAHLSLSLERLSAICAREPQRIGLSATVRPAAEAARWLGGDRPVELVDCAGPPRLDLRVEVPVSDLSRPWDRPGGPANPGPEDRSVWPALHERLLQLIRAHTTTLIFVNSRGLCEKLARDLNRLAGEELVASHHGSLSHARRTTVEGQLKGGELPALVATSSLELGIDMGSIDLVVCVEAPTSVSSGLQRVGRAGHSVGKRSEGVLLPKHRMDVVRCAVVGDEMRRGAIEAMHIPQNPLDVLAQQLVGICAEGEHPVDGLLDFVRRAAPYRGLTLGALHAVLRMLSGGYPANALLNLPPRLSWDRTQNLVRGRKGAAAVAMLNAGTIPDRGLFGVYLGEKGPRVGELDEEMVFESRVGDVFVLGSSAWRVEEIRQDRVIATPAPGRPGRLPFWRGDGPGRPIELGRALGSFLNDIQKCDKNESTALLSDRYQLDDNAIQNLRSLLNEQEQVCAIPTNTQVVLEHYCDDLGEVRANLLSPFGRRVHGPWAMAIEAALSRKTGVLVRSLATDDGITLRLSDPDQGGDILAALDLEVLLPDPETVDELVIAQVRHAPLFAALFREAAGRALLMPRTTPNRRRPLWAQRLRAQDLLAAVSDFPDFPLLLEVWREVLLDVFDLPGLRGLLTELRAGRIALLTVQTRGPSPFSRSLDMTLVADNMYEGDKTAADRKALVMSLDRELLRELMGEAPLGELLDAATADALEHKLQHLTPERRARDADALHDLLRVLGHLSAEAIADRCAGPWTDWLRQLEQERRVLRRTIGGDPVFIAAESASSWAAVLGGEGGEDPAGEDPAADLALRFARSHGPFLAAELAEWLGLGESIAETVLRRLEERGALLRLRHQGEARFCERGVHSRLRRRSAEAARAELDAVDGASYARFLLSWQGISHPEPAESGLELALERLRGLALPLDTLERQMLPARLRGFHPRQLDELGISGEWVWIGAGEGRVMLLRRDEAPTFAPRPGAPPELGLGAELLRVLSQRGACFLSELQAELGLPTGDLIAALRELAFAGWVSNDTLAPLRAAQIQPRRVLPGHLGPRRPLAAGGRWARVALPQPTPEARALALASALLDRWGLISGAILDAESLGADATLVRAVARAMEERGQLKRGFFVEGIGGMQYALPEAVEALRRARAPDGAAHMLAIDDPANPYGAALPWPSSAEPAPRRIRGAAVVLVDGAPVFALSAAGDQVTSFGQRDPELLALAAAALVRGARNLERGPELLRIDGAPAAGWYGADALRAAGFSREGERLRLSLL